MTVRGVGSGALFGQRTGGKPCRMRSLACDWGTRRGFIFRRGSRVRLSLSSKTETYTARGIRDAISGACLPQLPEPSRTTLFAAENARRRVATILERASHDKRSRRRTSKMSHAAVDVRGKTDPAGTQDGQPRWLWRLVRPTHRLKTLPAEKPGLRLGNSTRFHFPVG